MDLPAVLDPDDALAQPTRARLFVLLAELRRPACTAELAQSLELHTNGVRVHLERLERAGLVSRTRERQPRGRPRDAWIIAPDARPGGTAPRGYADLGRWLARALPSAAGEYPDIEAVGRAIGRELAPRDSAVGTDAIQSTMSALGFRPTTVEPDSDGTRSYCLGNCPYLEAVHQNAGVICTLHQGITEGLLDVLEPTLRLAAFEPRDPDVGGCRIDLSADSEPE